MWLNIIAVIVLVLFFSYFLKIKTNVGYEIEKKIDKIEEEKLPSSVIQARYEQSRYAFLKFAEFVLLKKRPFGFKNELHNDGVKGTISGATDKGIQTSVPSRDGCRTACLSDPLCNAWKYSPDKSCHKYQIDDDNQYKKEESSTDYIGYIFRPSDSNWAVQDLSKLPISADFFKAVANTVLALNCKIEKLRNKASQVISASSVRYCYETEVSSNSEESQEYKLARDEAISSLEHATKFFIFSGENDFSSDTDIFTKQKECSLYFSKIVDEMTSMNNSDTTDTTDSRLFAGEGEANWLAGVKEASEKLRTHYYNFTLVRDFFVSSLDKNYNSSIDRSELKAVYEQAIKSGQGLDMGVLKNMVGNDDDDDDEITQLKDKVGGLSLPIVNDPCEYDINTKVEDFFVLYDINRDDLVYLDELLQQVPELEYPDNVCG